MYDFRFDLNHHQLIHRGMRVKVDTPVNIDIQSNRMHCKVWNSHVQASSNPSSSLVLPCKLQWPAACAARSISWAPAFLVESYLIQIRCTLSSWLVLLSRRASSPNPILMCKEYFLHLELIFSLHEWLDPLTLTSSINCIIVVFDQVKRLMLSVQLMTLAATFVLLNVFWD